MLKKTISYTDFNGSAITEDFYFNLTKAELIELEVSKEGGLAKVLEEIVAANDGQKIIDAFKTIIMFAVGRKSEDGKRFIKSREIREEFEQTNAYSELFMELATNAEAAADFVNSIVPPADQLDPDKPKVHTTPSGSNEMTTEQLLEELRKREQS